MKKSEYLFKLSLLKLDTTKYCITGSGILLLHDLVDDVNDIDLVVERDYLLTIGHNFPLKYVHKDIRQLGNDVEFIIGKVDRNNIDHINGQPVLSLNEYKKKLIEMNRPKDKGKLELVEIGIEKQLFNKHKSS